MMRFSGPAEVVNFKPLERSEETEQMNNGKHALFLDAETLSEIVSASPKLSFLHATQEQSYE